jgi:Glycosyltransferase family 87
VRRPALALAVVWLVATTLGPTALDVPSDLPVYRGYAEALQAGLAPYRDFGVEYPPLALLPIGLAGLFGTGAAAYAWALGALMLVAALVVQREAAALAGPRGRTTAWLLVALPVAAGAIVRTRFDLFPAALALAGLAAIAAPGRRPRAALGFVLLALGTATKLFPAILAAVAFAWLLHAGRRREAWEGAALFAGVLGLVCLPFVVLSPAGFAAQFTFHLDRPVQIESSPGSVLWAMGDSFVTGSPVRPDRFKSNGLAGGPADAVALLFSVLELAAVLAAVALAGRGPRGDPRRLVLASLAALVAFVALGKVLSPQFVLWLAPPAAVAFALGDRLSAALVLAAVPLTQLEFPGRYFDLVDGDVGVVVLVAARNGLLLAALSLLLARLAGSARSRSPGAAAARSG